MTVLAAATSDASAFGLSTSDWVVLTVGLATVLMMIVTVVLQKRGGDRMERLVERQTAASEVQAKAAEAQRTLLETQIRRSLEAKLITAFGGGSPQQQNVRVFNGGQHPASKIRAWFVAEDGYQSPAASSPVLMPGEDTSLPLDTDPARVRRGTPPLALHLAWTDGLGDHEGPTDHQDTKI